MQIFAGVRWGGGLQMRVGWSKMAFFASFVHYIFQTVTYNASIATTIILLNRSFTEGTVPR